MLARPLVSPAWLHAAPRVGTSAAIASPASNSTPSVVVLDGTWHMPNANRNAAAEFQAKRIKGARFFDIDAVADKTSSLPHMLPSPAVFADSVGAMGISNDSHVVIYDAAQSIGAAARVLWTFRVFGHQGGLSILEGGLPAWIEAGYPTVSGVLGLVPGEEFPVEPKKYIANFNKHLVKSFQEVRENLSTPVSARKLIIDARPAGRFLGIDPEPRPGLSSGHMPGSISLPHSKLLASGNNKGFLRGKELAKALTDAGINLSEPAIHSCGSGVNASITWLGEILSRSEIKSGTWEELEDGLSVYDGSWTEWAGRVEDGAIIEK